ncbi:Transmembrane protein [Toxocara canis]|uniref:Transmembrane protein n=1 Tax=Toxocara canis TaxID=6265 RepID=A0A0B2UWQ7_TOXCA|nr:Transmembrane protein [Toxocara canis]
MPKDELFSLFAEGNSTANSFSLWEVLTLESEDMVSFWEMWLGITVWMTVSYAFVYFLAAAVSTLMLRKHPWMLAITIPMLGCSFSLWEVLTLESEDMVSFWEMWLGITVWMTVSYAFVYFLAAAVSTLMLRKHPWMLAITIPMLAMSVICPATLGALTSATIALTFSSADKAISCSHCMALGCAQTFFAVIIGFSRILATL